MVGGKELIGATVASVAILSGIQHAR